MPSPRNFQELMEKANTYLYVDCQSGAEVAPPLEGVQHPYLLEIWQNVNGRKVAWFAVATFDRGRWYDLDANELGPSQVAMRWVKISDISAGWQTYTSQERQEMMQVRPGDLVTIQTDGLRCGPYEVTAIDRSQQHPFQVNTPTGPLWVAEVQLYQGEEVEEVEGES